jgi:hypothetical protein
MPIRNAIADNVGDDSNRTSGANVPLNRSQRRHGVEAGLISNGINYSAVTKAAAVRSTAPIR